jgi:hypothetical protein
MVHETSPPSLKHSGTAVTEILQKIKFMYGKVGYKERRKRRRKGMAKTESADKKNRQETEGRNRKGLEKLGYEDSTALEAE